MKNKRRVLMSAAAIFVMALALCVTSVTAQAATKTKKLTMYVGEQFTIYTIGGKMTSVKSSKKKVCTAKKKSGNTVVTAKKAGKSNITIKTTRGKIVYKITVKKNPFKVTASASADGSLILKLQNTSGGYFDWVDLNVTLCDSAGNPVTQKTESIFYVGSKQTAYGTVYVYDNGIDLSKTKIAISNWKRTPDASYKNYSKKVSASLIEDNGYIKLRANTNYSGKGYIYVAYDIAFKNASGQIIKVSTESTSLYSSRKVNTTYGSRMPDDAVSYEVLSKRIYLKNY